MGWTEADLLRHPQLSRARTGRDWVGAVGERGKLVSGEKWKNEQNKGKEGQVGSQATEDGTNSPHSGEFTAADISGHRLTLSAGSPLKPQCKCPYEARTCLGLK